MPAKKSNGPAHVGSYVHPDKRVNNPTADAVAAYGIADDALEPLLYPRDSSLDPQLVWRGKDAQDREDLVVGRAADLHPGEDRSSCAD